MSSWPQPPCPATRRRAPGYGTAPALLLALLLPSTAHASLELRAADLADGARLTLRLDACATPGPLLQVREADGAVRVSLDAEDLDLTCTFRSLLPSADSPGEGSWVQDWWVDEQAGIVVLVDRRTRAPRVVSLQTGERGRLSAEVMEERLANEDLWPRQQLRALDLAAAWTPLQSLGAMRSVLGDPRRPPVVRLRAAALMSAYGDDSGKRYVLALASPAHQVSGLRPRSQITGADLGQVHYRSGGGLLCDRPPPASHERPDDAAAARQYAIQLLPTVLGFEAVPQLRDLVQSNDPVDRVAVRTALMCLSLKLPGDDPRAARLAEVARWTGGGAGLTIDGPSLRELEASAGSPDRYIAGQAIRSLLARDGGTEDALLRLLQRGTPHDGLIALHFATHPSERAVEPLLAALDRHSDKSRAASLLVMALRASVSDEERDALAAANGASPSRWKAWARQRALERRERLDPLALLVSLLPLGVLIGVTSGSRRRP